MAELADPLKKLLADLSGTPLLLMEAKLKPVQGQRFQPTGFADLGPARYKAPRETGPAEEMLLVESPQSVANWLEAMCWEPPQLGRAVSLNCELAPALKGMPYVVVEQPIGTKLTNSIIEAHRLNSAYILGGTDTTVFDILKSEAAGMEKGPIDIQKLARSVFKLDPNSVLHGLFLAKKELAGGRLRLSRLLSGFIEAAGVEPAENGGVKIDHVSSKTVKGSGQDSTTGFGNIVYHRTEFTARERVAYFNMDLALLRGYGLGDAAEAFLIAFGLYKVVRFLRHGLSLRTACKFEVDGGLKITRPDAFAVPDEPTAASLVQAALGACRAEGGLLRDAKVTTVVYQEKKAAKPAQPEGTEDAENEEGEE